ncbi:hypothetical protein DIRU0_B02168 [Diutina rugosa]
MNQTGPPQTPRNRSKSGMVSSTPQMSFGLSFSPSFALSPLPSASPGSMMMKSQTPPKKSLLDTLATRKRPLSATSTPHIDSSGEEDLWTTLDANTLSTSLTSIYEEPPPAKRSCPESAPSEWTAKLDAVLLKAYHKLNHFRHHPNNPPAPTLLATPPPKVLSRIVHAKTGVTKSAAEIAQRLQVLTRDNLDEWATAASAPVPRASAQDSVNTNEIIDRELNSFLLSPSATAYELVVTHFDLSYHPQSTDPAHRFATMMRPGSPAAPASVLGEVIDQCTPAIDFVNQMVFPQNTHIPVFIGEHAFDLKIPLAPTQPLDLVSGTFKSYMRLVATLQTPSSSPSPPPPMLSWRCNSMVWNNFTNQQIYQNTDFINGYPLAGSSADLASSPQPPGAYDVQVPFLKTLLAGYINFVIQGGGECNLTVAQVLYDGNSTNPTDQPYAVVVHRITDAGVAKPGSRFSTVKLSAPLESREFMAPAYVAPPATTTTDTQQYTVNDVEDDNETVIADSSPYKSTPRHDGTPADYGASPMPRKRFNMTIDIDRAGFIMGHQGPMTAPVYNPDQMAKYAPAPSCRGSVVAPPPHGGAVPDEYDHQFMQAHRLPPDQRMLADFDTLAHGPMGALNPPPHPGMVGMGHPAKGDKMEITFGPILEYDPSKNPSAAAAKAPPPATGQHRFPVNPTMSIYKPKK